MKNQFAKIGMRLGLGLGLGLAALSGVSGGLIGLGAPVAMAQSQDNEEGILAGPRLNSRDDDCRVGQRNCNARRNLDSDRRRVEQRRDANRDRSRDNQRQVERRRNNDNNEWRRDRGRDRDDNWRRDRDRRSYGYRNYGYRDYGYRPYRNDFFAQPFIYETVPSAPVYSYGYNTGNRVYSRAHVDWCLNRYRSYNPATNLWLSYGGQYRACNSPFD